MGRINIPFVDAIPMPKKTYYYYRRGKLRIRLPGEPGDKAFNEAYEKIHLKSQSNFTKKNEITHGSIRDLIAHYKESPEWKEKKPETQRDYNKALIPLAEKFGHLPVRNLPRQFVLSLRDIYAQKKMPDGTIISTPRRANRMVAVLSILLSHSIDLGWRNDNPALRPKKLKTGTGYSAWSRQEVEMLLTAETTTNEIKLAILLAVSTGQRGQDLIKMKWEDYDGEGIYITQLKTGANIWIPLHKRVKSLLEVTQRTSDFILNRPDGKPWKIDHFRHSVQKQIKLAGIKGRALHGLRVTAASWLAEAGCSEREIMSITGHSNTHMVSRYVRDADQKKRAESAITKVEKYLSAKSGESKC